MVSLATNRIIETLGRREEDLLNICAAFAPLHFEDDPQFFDETEFFDIAELESRALIVTLQTEWLRPKRLSPHPVVRISANKFVRVLTEGSAIFTYLETCAGLLTSISMR